MHDTILREQLLKLLQGGNAYITFENAVADFPIEHINSRVENIPYSPWELVEHMRIAQYDILDFMRNPNYVEPKWPDDYWPAKDTEATSSIWDQTLKDFENDLNAIKEMVQNLQTDLTSPIPHAPTYNVLREILLVADHNAYHTGQIITLKRALGIY